MQRLNEGTLSTYYVHNFVLLANAFTCILIFRQKTEVFVDLLRFVTTVELRQFQQKHRI